MSRPAPMAVLAALYDERTEQMAIPMATASMMPPTRRM